MAAFTTIDDPSAYFKVQLYTGSGGTQSITFDDTDTDMQPDLVWIKSRNDTNPHTVVDAVRGATKVIWTNVGSVEGTFTDEVTAFDSDGFSLGASSNAYANENTITHVAWCWKESATSGMDIVQYTGNATDDVDISHSLSAVPHLIILKNLNNSNAESWAVYHHKNTSAPETDKLVLNNTAATADNDEFWSDEVPTSSVFTIGRQDSVNGSGNSHIAYLFSEKQGFSKFGSYVGNNGGSNGVFVYTGFRPKLVIQKLSSNAGANWIMRDTARDTYNPMDNQIEANTLDAKEDNHAIDFLSNGFKTRANGLNQQDNGETYIYMAFAEAPFVNSNGVPCNAR